MKPEGHQQQVHRERRAWWVRARSKWLPHPGTDVPAADRSQMAPLHGRGSTCLRSQRACEKNTLQTEPDRDGSWSARQLGQLAACQQRRKRPGPLPTCPGSECNGHVPLWQLPHSLLQVPISLLLYELEDVGGQLRVLLVLVRVPPQAEELEGLLARGDVLLLGLPQLRQDVLHDTPQRGVLGRRHLDLARLRLRLRLRLPRALRARAGPRPGLGRRPRLGRHPGLGPRGGGAAVGAGRPRGRVRPRGLAGGVLGGRRRLPPRLVAHVLRGLRPRLGRPGARSGARPCGRRRCVASGGGLPRLGLAGLRGGSPRRLPRACRGR
mmetsp:Transcript_100751/g.313280  ORF Transcript_100751/g.313280 Transcript_100751/m.313280 type:complete len:323 (-) Transcript_100751:989-1957(-)